MYSASSKRSGGRPAWCRRGASQARLIPAVPLSCVGVARVSLAAALLATGLLATLGTSGCERERRQFRPTAASSATPEVRVSSLQPGPAIITDSGVGPYAANAYAISQGKQLFSEMNCVGCHSHGGGGMGPALMDATWLYGSHPAQLFASIQQGRPNGMPSFRGRLSNDQIWRLVAYVRTLSGIGRRDVRGGRDDAMYSKSSEQNTQTRKPVTSEPPAASEGH